MKLPKELENIDLSSSVVYRNTELMNEDFLDKYSKFLDWRLVIKYNHLSEDFIEKHKKVMDWDYILLYQKHISDDFIIKHKDEITHWDFLGVHRPVSVFLGHVLYDKINWAALAVTDKLSEEFIREFRDKLDWTRITMGYARKFSDSFIREMKDYIDWYYLFTERKNMSMDFIREIVKKLLPTKSKYTIGALANQITDDNFLEMMNIFKKYDVEHHALENVHHIRLSDETIINNYVYFDMSILWNIKNGNISKKLRKVFDNSFGNKFGL